MQPDQLELRDGRVDADYGSTRAVLLPARDKPDIDQDALPPRHAAAVTRHRRCIGKSRRDVSSQVIISTLCDFQIAELHCCIHAESKQSAMKGWPTDPGCSSVKEQLRLRLMQDLSDLSDAFNGCCWPRFQNRFRHQHLPPDARRVLTLTHLAPGFCCEPGRVGHPLANFGLRISEFGF